MINSRGENALAPLNLAYSLLSSPGNGFIY